MTESPPLLANHSVYIATPCMDGKYDREYARSIFNTIILLQNQGIETEWLELPFCSDLPYARSRIFGKFLRSDATHLLMIDSDMGWNPQDVLKMLAIKRDFIAGVGMKKKEGIEFALVNCDDHGNVLPILIEADTGIMDISEVGMAFVMISRACAQKMANHYNELIYDNMGQDEHDLFQPFIIPGSKRRLPEDFAFCYRWRKLGGKVHVAPDIRLQHVGRKVWEGAMSDLTMGGQNG